MQNKHWKEARLIVCHYRFLAENQDNILINVAMLKVTSQSSSLGRIYNARKAVDGNTNGVINIIYGICMHTKELKGSWWQVDLEQIHAVSAVIIFNRNVVGQYLILVMYYCLLQKCTFNTRCCHIQYFS